MSAEIGDGGTAALSDGRDGSGGAVDLDAAPTPPSSADPAPAPVTSARWRLRPVVWLLLAALVGAGAGAAVAARHAGSIEQARAAADRGERAVLALQAGQPSLARGASTPDPRGRSTVMLAVPLFNRGTDPLRLTVQALELPGGSSSGQLARLEVGPGGSRVRVVPGATATAAVPVVVRCGDVLPPALGGRSRGAIGTALRVSVEVPGGSRRATLPLAEPNGGTVADIVSYACGPPQQRRAPVSVTWTPLPDGDLEVAVAQPYSTDTLVLDVQQSPGLGVRSDPALPVSGTSGAPVVMTLTMDPTCSAVAPPGRVPTASLDVVTVAGDQVQAGVPDDDGIVAAWVARRLALSCG